MNWGLNPQPPGNSHTDTVYGRPTCTSNLSTNLSACCAYDNSYTYNGRIGQLLTRSVRIQQHFNLLFVSFSTATACMVDFGIPQSAVLRNLFTYLLVCVLPCAQVLANVNDNNL